MKATELKQYAIASANIHRNLKYLMTVRQTVAILKELDILPNNYDKLTIDMFVKYWCDKISMFHQYVGFNFNNSITIIKTEDGGHERSDILQKLILSLSPAPPNIRALNIYKMLEDEDGIYVGRPSVFGNPVKLEKGEEFNEERQKTFKNWAINDGDFIDNQHLLYGKNLICFCTPKPCHADAVLSILEDNHAEIFSSSYPYNTFAVTLTGSSVTTRRKYIDDLIPIWHTCPGHNIEIAAVQNSSIFLIQWFKGLDALLRDISLLNKKFKLKENEVLPEVDVQPIHGLSNGSIAVLSFYPSFWHTSKISSSYKFNGKKYEWIGTALKQLIHEREVSKVGFTEFEVEEINRLLGGTITDPQIIGKIVKYQEDNKSQFNYVKSPLFDEYIKMTKANDYLTIAIDDTNEDKPIIYTNLPIDINTISPWDSYEKSLSNLLSDVIRWMISGSADQQKVKPVYLIIKSISEQIPGGHYVFNFNQVRVETRSEIGDICVSSLSCTFMGFTLYRYTNTLGKYEGLSVTTYGTCYAFADDKSKTWLKMGELTSKILARKINLFSIDIESSSIRSNGLNNGYLVSFLPKTTVSKNEIGEHVYAPDYIADNRFSFSEHVDEIDLCIADKGPFKYNAYYTLI